MSKTQLAEYVDMTPREVRHVLDCFESYGLITKENVRNKYTLITVLPVCSTGQPLQRKPVTAARADVKAFPDTSENIVSERYYKRECVDENGFSEERITVSSERKFNNKTEGTKAPDGAECFEDSISEAELTEMFGSVYSEW